MPNKSGVLGPGVGAVFISTNNKKDDEEQCFTTCRFAGYRLSQFFRPVSYEQQTHMDCFSSNDLVHWTKHPNIIDTSEVKWVKKCLWTPAALKKGGKYYVFLALPEKISEPFGF